MRVSSALPFLATMALLVVPLIAQENLPHSYLEFVNTVDQLRTLTETDVRQLTMQAQSGAPEAQYQLALMYECCETEPRDEAPARHWMLKAAEQGYVPAEAGMGKLYINLHTTGTAPNYAEADRWLRLAAMQGDAEAQFWLGEGYRHGFYGAVDLNESLKWLREAANEGLPLAEFSLGQMYEDGEGVSKIPAIAAKWYRKAADHLPEVKGSRICGVFEAETQLMYMYRDGRLKGNDPEAYMWLVIVDSSVDPPIDPASDRHLKQFAKRMTEAEIADARQRAKDWTDHHLLRAD